MLWLKLIALGWLGMFLGVALYLFIYKDDYPAGDRRRARPKPSLWGRIKLLLGRG